MGIDPFGPTGRLTRLFIINNTSSEDALQISHELFLCLGCCQARWRGEGGTVKRTSRSALRHPTSLQTFPLGLLSLTSTPTPMEARSQVSSRMHSREEKRTERVRGKRDGHGRDGDNAVKRVIGSPTRPPPPPGRCCCWRAA